MSKGCKKRKTQISEEQFQDNWDRIFKKKTEASSVAALVKNIEPIEQKDDEDEIKKNIEPRLDNVQCIWLDSGSCYHPTINIYHACPGILHCDVDLKV